MVYVRRSIIPSVVIVALVTACSSSSPPDSSPAATRESLQLGGTEHLHSEALAAAVAEGEINHDTYLAGYRRFAACMRDAGTPLVMESEVNLVMTYSVVPGAAEEKCYASEFEPLDIAWQIHQENTSASAETIRNCLNRNGVAPEPTLSQMTQQLVDEGIPLEDCM